MSANLRRALKKLEEKGGSLDDLPTNREATDWNVIAGESSLGPLELVALKTHREQQRSTRMVSEVVVFVLLYSICCSIIEEIESLYLAFAFALVFLFV